VIVLVDVSRRPHREVGRYACKPEDADVVERVTRSTSRNGRTVRAFGVGLYSKPWRQQTALDALYEAHDGEPTPDYRPLVA